jgi:hypothetical protein
VLRGGGCVFAGKSCLAIHVANPTAPDGVYQLDPDGPGGAAPFFAYCDMTSDGGGWMKILQYKDAPYTPTAAAVGDITTADTPAMAKLADAQVNALGSLAPMREYRFQGATSTKRLHLKSGTAWDDTARGHDLFPTGTGYACEGEPNASCPYVLVTTPANYPMTVDSGLWMPALIGGDDADRYFTDFSAPVHCFATGSTTERCYCSGLLTGYAVIQNLSIWTRELAD